MTARAHWVPSAALLIDLIAVAVLAGIGPAFPRGVGVGTGWEFVGTHHFAVAHTVLGALVLGQAVALMVKTRARAQAVILAGVLLAVGSGGVYVSAGQPEVALTLMTLGWLVSVGATAVDLVRQRQHHDESGARRHDEGSPA